MSFAIHMYEPPLSLWGIIQEYISDSEHYEVKTCLGEDLIEQSIELRKEINTLLEIYHDFREMAAAGGDSSPVNVLPEPPDLRNRMKQEIVFFLEGIRENAKTQGRDINKILQKHNSDVIDYAYESGSSRPSTSDSSLTTSRSCSLLVTPLSSRAGSTTTARSSRLDVGAMQSKLNYLEFDEVRTNLRAHLHEEVDQLRQDLEEIQLSLCDEESERTRSLTRMTTAREPSLLELKEERHRLEQTLLESSRATPNLPDTRKVPPPRSAKPLVHGPVKVIHAFVPCPPTHKISPSRPTSTGAATANVPPLQLGPLAGGGDSTIASLSQPESSTASSDFIYSSRPTSAQRFRNMVLDCRQDIGEL